MSSSIGWSPFIKRPPAYLPLFPALGLCRVPSHLWVVQRRGRHGGERGRRWKYIEKKKREGARAKQCKVGHTFVIKSKPNASVCVRWNYLILFSKLNTTSECVCECVSSLSTDLLMTRLLPYLDFCKLCCYEYWDPCIFPSPCFCFCQEVSHSGGWLFFLSFFLLKNFFAVQNLLS